MKISIITICYNSAKTLEDTIKSVLSQTYDNIEYIIIDGASKDGTMDIVERYKDKISTIVSEPDKGIYDAMNKGVSRATGDVVGILNSDDFYKDTNVIADVAAKFESENIDGLYADLVYVDREDENKIIRYWKSGEYKKGQFLKGWMPPHPTFFVKNELYKKLGLYNIAFKSGADYELMLRFIHKHEITLGYLARVITKMRVGGESNASLKNRIRGFKEAKMSWKVNGLQPGAFTLIRKPLSKLSQFIKKG